MLLVLRISEGINNEKEGEGELEIYKLEGRVVR